MSLSEETKELVLELRDKGLTYEQIAKKVKIRKSTVGQIVRSQASADVKEGMIRQSTNNPLPGTEILEAKILKPCVNPRIIIIYFGEKENQAKCVVTPGYNYPYDKEIKVKKVEFSEAEPLYRIIE